MPLPSSDLKIEFPAAIPENFDLQGHRGCRGLMPENTIPGFIHALNLGVRTLEMDVVISRDRKVILSHDPWMSPEFCRMPDGSDILDNVDKPLIFQLTEHEVSQFDCGSRPYAAFPQQKHIRASKPSLKAVIDAAENHARNTGRPAPRYNIETKSTPAGDHIYHPDPDTFADLLGEVLTAEGIAERSTVQSFDVRTLQRFHNRRPEIVLSLLVEDEETLETHLNELGFVPQIYSPEYRIVNAELIAECRGHGMQIIPWTVNEASDMAALVRLGVDGLITDYPDRFPKMSGRTE